MSKDTISRQGIVREHLKAILDEAIAGTVELDSYGDELDAYANAVIQGLGIHASFVGEGHVVISGAFSRTDIQ